MTFRVQRIGWMLAALSATVFSAPLTAGQASAAHGPAPQAFAAPAVAAQTSAAHTARAPLGQYASTLTFDVTDLSPTLVTATGISTARFAGTLTNTGTEELTDVVARIQRGDPLASPDELQTEIADPSQPAVSWTPFAPLLDSVDPGQTVPFSLTGDLFGDVNDSLALTEPGVYPVMLNVNARFESGPSNGARVGEFHALLTVASVPATSGDAFTKPGEQEVPAAPPPVRLSQQINLLMPLVDRPHRDPTGAFFDDDLARLIAPGGRLDRVLEAATSPDLPDRSRTVAVDPELLEELQLMSQGYFVGPDVFDLSRTVPGTDTVTASSSASTTGSSPSPTTGSSPSPTTGSSPSPTTGGSAPGSTSESPPTSTPATQDTSSTTTTATTSATATAVNPLVPGPDVIAGVGTGDAVSFLERLRELALTQEILVLPYSDMDTVSAVRNGHPDQVTSAVTRGQQIAAAVLGAGARLTTDVSWPIDGLTDRATLSVLRSAGLSTAVLDTAGVSGAGSAAVATVDTDSGTVAAALSSTEVPSGATQLNEFTAVTAQNYFSAVAAPRVLAPVRSWQPDDQMFPAMTALIDELGAAGIVSGATIETLTATSTATATLEYPDDARARELPASVFGRIEGLKGLLGETQSAFTPIGDVLPGDRATTAPDNLFSGILDGLARQTAGGYRIDPAAGERSDSAVETVLTTIQAGAFINPPAGNYTLTSSSSPLLVTLTNNTPYTVHLRVSINSSDAARAGITVTDVDVLTVQAQRSLPVTLPAETTKAGTLSIRVQLTTPDGARWGGEQTLQLRSTAYGAFTVTMIVIAGIVVVLTTAVRILKRYRQRNERIRAGLQ